MQYNLQTERQKEMNENDTKLQALSRAVSGS